MMKNEMNFDVMKNLCWRWIWFKCSKFCSWEKKKKKKSWKFSTWVFYADCLEVDKPVRKRLFAQPEALKSASEGVLSRLQCWSIKGFSSECFWWSWKCAISRRKIRRRFSRARFRKCFIWKFFVGWRKKMDEIPSQQLPSFYVSIVIVGVVKEFLT